jgi:hypothetical protein
LAGEFGWDANETERQIVSLETANTHHPSVFSDK